MLTIRASQIAVFSQLEIEKFQDWMLSHLQRFFPERCGIAGEARLRETIRIGIDRAAAYDLHFRSDVCKYIDLMVVFGRDFDKDARYPWVVSTELCKRRSE